MGLKALIVDHNSTNREILRHQMEAWSISTHVAVSAAQALEMLGSGAAQKKPFTLAIIDRHLPDLDGPALARVIKSNPATQDVHLILLCSVLDDDNSEELSGAGFERYLMRPVRKSQLFDCIADCVGTAQLASWASNGSESPMVRPAEGTPFLRRRILIAEDNDVNQEVTRDMLEVLGCSAEIAKDGQEAVGAVKEKAYDLVLMDCQMPEMDGFEATRAIRQHESRGNPPAHLPIIALTADAVEGDRERCLAAGMDDYLAKPFTLDELRKILSQWLPANPGAVKDSSPASGAGEGAGNPAAKPALSLSGSKTTEGGPVDRRALKNIAYLQRPGAPNVLEKVISMYLQSSRALLERLQQAVGSRDAEETRKAAHSLKSSSANVGATHLAALSKELEDAGRAHALDMAGRQLDRMKAEHARVVAALEEELAGVSHGYRRIA
jgi:CheY-like chemotaxis protein